MMQCAGHCYHCSLFEVRDPLLLGKPQQPLLINTDLQQLYHWCLGLPWTATPGPGGTRGGESMIKSRIAFPSSCPVAVSHLSARLTLRRATAFFVHWPGKFFLVIFLWPHSGTYSGHELLLIQSIVLNSKWKFKLKWVQILGEGNQHNSGMMLNSGILFI